MNTDRKVSEKENPKPYPKDRFAHLITIVLLLAVISIAVIIAMGYANNWKWVGVMDNQKGEIKTLWDWMELLIIPIVLAIGAYLLNKSDKAHERKIADEQRKNEKKIADERASVEQEIAKDSQRQTSLETYFDRMTELLLVNNLRKSSEGDEVRSIARTRTLTILNDLDGKRKAQVVQFLYELDLIKGDKPIIDMSYADLQGVDLAYANLSNISLPKSNLRNANLHSAKLQNANFHSSDLDDADLSWADLRGANLRCGLKRANLGVAQLENADLTRADLGGACLINANLNGANLRNANLKYKHEPTGDFEQDNIALAELVFADLRDCNMTGAKIDIEQIKNAKYLKGAILPDGKEFQGRYEKSHDE